MRVLLATVLGRRRVHIEGVDNVPTIGGALIVGNHVGAMDPPFVGAAIPRLDVHYMAKSETFEHAPWRWLLRGFQAFPVVRGSADRTAVRYAVDLLHAGHIVVVYPEGSRSPDGRMHGAQPGVGFLARHGAVPVIPVAVWGTEKVLPRGTIRIHRGDVHLRFGPAVALPVTAGVAHVDNRVVAAAVMDAVAAMLPHAYRPRAERATEADNGSA